VARRDLLINGVVHKQGDIINTETIKPRLLRLLYEQGRVLVATEEEIRAAGKAAHKATRRAEREVAMLPPKPATISSAVADPAPDVAYPQEALSAAGIQARHLGFGRWGLFNSANEQIEGPMSKAEAAAKIEALRTQPAGE
jgi:hypothetical protein